MILVSSTSEKSLIKVLSDGVIKAVGAKGAFKPFYELVDIKTPLAYTSYVDAYWRGIFRENWAKQAHLIFEPKRRPDYCLPNNPLPFVMIWTNLPYRKEIDGVDIQLDDKEFKVLFDSIVFHKSFFTPNCVKKMLNACPERKSIKTVLKDKYEELMEAKNLAKEIRVKAVDAFVGTLDLNIKDSASNYTEVLFHDNIKIKPIAVIHPAGDNFLERMPVKLPVHKNLDSAFKSGNLPKKQY